jgi:DNA repair exonuclease SbcCD ATPase subunit
LISEWKENGAGMEKAHEAVTLAKARFEIKRYQEASSLVLKGMSIAEKEIIQFKKYEELLSNIKELKGLTRIVRDGCGKDISDIEQQIAGLEQTDDYEEAIVETKRYIATFKETIQDIQSELDGRIKEVSQYLNASESKGINLDQEKNFFNESKRLIENEQYLDAWSAIETVQKSITEKDDLFTEIGKKLESITNFLPKMEKAGLDLNVVEDRISSIRNMDDYNQSLKSCKELLSEMNDSIYEYENKAKNAIKEIENCIQVFNENDVPTTNIEELLDSSKALFDEGRYSQVISIGETALENASKILDDYAELKQRFMELERKIDELEQLGIPVDDMVSDYEGIIAVKDYTISVEKAGALANDLIERFENYKNELKLKISAIKNYIKEQTKIGVFLDGPDKMISDAYLEFENGNFMNMNALFTETEDMINMQIKKHDDIQKMHAEIMKSIENAESLGIETSHYREELEYILTMKNYDEAAQRCDKIASEIIESLKDKENDAQKIIYETYQFINEIKNQDIKIPEAETSFQKAKDYIDKGMLIEAITEANNSKMLAEREKNLFIDVLSLIEKTEKALTSLKSQGLEVDGIVDGLFSALEQSTYAEAYDKIQIIHTEVEDIRTTLEKKANDAINEIEGIVDDLIKKNIKATAISRLLNSSKKEFERGHIPRCLDYCQEAKTMAQALEKQYVFTKEAIDAAHIAIEMLESLGIEKSEELNKRILLIEEDDDYKQAKEMAESIEDEAIKIRDKVEFDIEQLISKGEAAIEELSLKDISIEDLSIELSEAKKSKRELLLKDADERAKSLLTKIQTIGEQLSEADRLITEIMKDIKYYEDAGLDLYEINDQLKLIKTIKDPKQLLDSISQFDNKFDDVLNNIIGKKEDELNEIFVQIKKLREKGIMVDNNIELFKEAEKALKDDKFTIMDELLVKNRAEIKELLDQHKIFTEKMEAFYSIINDVENSGLNIKTQQMKNQMDILKQQYDYKIIIEVTKDLIELLRINISTLKEEAENEINAVKGSMHFLESMKVDLGEINEMVIKADSGLKGGRYSDALSQAKEAHILCKEMETNQKKYKSYRSSIKIAIKNLKIVGIDIKDIENKYKKIEKVENIKEANEQYSEIEQQINYLKDKYNDQFTSNLEILENDLQASYEDGIKCRRLINEINTLKKSYEEGELVSTLKSAEKIRRKLDDAKRYHKDFVKVLESVEESIDRLEDLGGDVRDLNEELDKAYDIDNYDKAVSLINKIPDDIENRRKQLLERKEKELDDIESKLEILASSNILSEMGIDTITINNSIIKEQNLLQTAQFIEYNHVHNNTIQLHNKINKKVCNYLQTSLVSIETDIEDMSELNVDTSDIIQFIMNSRELIDNEDFNEAYNSIPEILNMIKSLKENALKRDENIQKIKVEMNVLDMLHIKNNDIKPFISDLTESELVEDALLGTESILAELERRKQNLLDETESYLSSIKDRIEELKNYDMDVQPMLASTDTICAKITNTDYEGISDDIAVLEDMIIHAEKFIDKRHEMIQLPFMHGMETELQIVTEDGHWIMGKKMLDIFPKILKDACENLQYVISDYNTPEYIKQRIKGFHIKKDSHNNDAIHVTYEIKGKTKDWPIIGKDSHVSVDTNILEIQTPPCQFLKELEWWLHTVFKTSYESISSMGVGLTIISTGMNPVESFYKGVTFGDHHHIDIPDDELRIHVYNMLRNFIPHLIAISVNSPFENSKTPEIQYNVINNSIISPMNSLSRRLEKNEGQLGIPPALKVGDTPEDFMEYVNRDEENARLIDMYPFTRFGTIEVRMIDTQLSIADRISIAALIQTISLFTKKMVEEGRDVPRISKEILKRNRENAFKSGMLAPFIPDRDLYNSNIEFANIYQGEEKERIHIQNAISNLLSLVKEEIGEMHIGTTNYLHPIYIKVFGTENNDVLGAPITSSQFQLFILDKRCEGNINVLINTLKAFSAKTAENKSYNPIIDNLGHPMIPEFIGDSALDLTIDDIVIPLIPQANEERKGSFAVKVINPGSEKKADVQIRYKVINSEDSVLFEDMKKVGIIYPKKERTHKISFLIPTHDIIHKLSAELLYDGNVILKDIEVAPKLKIGVNISWIGRKEGYIIKEKPVPIPYSIKVNNDMPVNVEATLQINIIESITNKILTSKEFQVTLNKNDRTIFAAMTSSIAEWAVSSLENQIYYELLPIEMPIIKDAKNKYTCKLSCVLELKDKTIIAESKETFNIYHTKS